MKSEYTISTVAGADPVRDGHPAVAAVLQQVRGIAFDGSGRLFIADYGADRIRGIAPDTTRSGPYTAYRYGTISTVAGVGASSFSGDGGPATEAHISGPLNLAFDSDGNLYFTDSDNARVRMVDAAGTIRTVAGGGSVVNAEDVPATSILLTQPTGIAIRPDRNVFVSEATGRILRISSSGVATTIAGVGTLGLEADGGPANKARLLNPGALALDSEGNLYVCEQGRSSIRKVTPEGAISTVAGTGTRGFSGDGGAASKAQLNSPIGIALDKIGNLFILDANNQRIRIVSPDGVIQTHQTLYNESVYLSGLSMDPSGRLWIADVFGVEVLEQGDSIGVCCSTVQSRDGALAKEALLSPWGLAVDREGLIYFSEIRFTYSPPALRIIDKRGILSSIPSWPPIATPWAIVGSPHGDLWIEDSSYPKICKLTRADGTIRTVAGNGVRGVSGDGGPATEAQLSTARWMAVDVAGNLFLRSSSSNTVRKVGSDGIIQTIAGNGQREYAGDGGPATEAQLGPAGVAVDKLGTLYIADAANRRIRSVSPAGIITTVAGGGSHKGDGPAIEADIPAPQSLAVTPTGDLFFTTYSAIYRIGPSGWLERIAGGDLPGFGGDNGPARDAWLYMPNNLWVEVTGSIYFADVGNLRIRKLTPVQE